MNHRPKILLLILLCSLPMHLPATVITLKSNESITVEILEATPSTLVVQHAILGELQIEMAQIEQIDQVDASTFAAQLRPPPPQKDWKHHFISGFSLQSGNTEQSSLNLALLSKRERATDKTTLDLSYLYGEEESERNSNQVTMGLLYDWLLPDSRWSYFVTPRFDYDEFNSWEYRVTLHVGPAYRLITGDQLNVFLRLGAGGSKEFKSERNAFIPEILFGADLEWQINQSQDLLIKMVFFPDLEDTGEFRALNNIVWHYKLSKKNGLGLNLGLYNEYQSLVSQGNKKNNLRLSGGLSYTF